MVSVKQGTLRTKAAVHSRETPPTLMTRVRITFAVGCLLLLILQMNILSKTAVPNDYGSASTVALQGSHPHHTGPKVAIIVAGTLNRYLFNSTIEKLIHPMVSNYGAEVDYYLSLTTAVAPSYRASGGYMSHATTDLPPSLKNDTDSIAAFITKSLRQVGSSAKKISIQHSIDVDADEMLQLKRKKALDDHPDEDPDLRFPLIDLRSSDAKSRTAAANRNLLKMHYAIQELWESAVAWEKESGRDYDLAIFMRDDSHWLSEFSLTPFVDGYENKDVFAPSCDARDPPLAIHEMNDHIIISRRRSADIFGNYYTKLHQADTEDCRKWTNFAYKGRGCNSEMLLKYTLEREHVQVQSIPQSYVPFQRSANVRMLDNSTQLCFHKFCQSQEKPVILDHVDMGPCQKLEIKLIPTPRL